MNPAANDPEVPGDPYLTYSFSDKVRLRQPTAQDAQQLAHILSTDIPLRRDLSIDEDVQPTAEEFLARLADWCKLNSATTYAIVVGSQAVGTVSLSHVDLAHGTARVGYWIGSDYRQKGFCTEAFWKILGVAAGQGIRSVSARIRDVNIPSQRIWRRFGAVHIAFDSLSSEYHLQVGDVWR